MVLRVRLQDQDTVEIAMAPKFLLILDGIRFVTKYSNHSRQWSLIIFSWRGRAKIWFGIENVRGNRKRYIPSKSHGKKYVNKKQMERAT